MNDEEKPARSATAHRELLQRSILRLEGMAERLARQCDHLGEWTVRSVVNDLRDLRRRPAKRDPSGDGDGGSGAPQAALDPPASNRA